MGEDAGHDIKRRGLMLVLSSPSGAGKTTLAKMLLKHDKHLHESISVTTRNKRPGEIEGHDYYFVNDKKFNNLINENQLIEHVKVFSAKYGTPKFFVEEHMANGEDILFEIDWQGNRQLTAMARNDVVSVFILPPSKNILLQRLKKRNQDDLKTIEYRISTANAEISHWHEYDYTIINRNLEESLNKLLAILRAERLKKARRTGLQQFIEHLSNEFIVNK